MISRHTRIWHWHTLLLCNLHKTANNSARMKGTSRTSQFIFTSLAEIFQMNQTFMSHPGLRVQPTQRPTIVGRNWWLFSPFSFLPQYNKRDECFFFLTAFSVSRLLCEFYCYSYDLTLYNVKIYNTLTKVLNTVYLYSTMWSSANCEWSICREKLLNVAMVQRRLKRIKYQRVVMGYYGIVREREREKSLWKTVVFEWSLWTAEKSY